MNLKQLQAFREVMLTGSVSNAAENLGRTQPAISSLIANLEDDLGIKLFQRRNGRLHPVPEAHYLLEEARIISERLDGARRLMQGIKTLDRGKIHMAAMLGPSVWFLPDLLSRFLENRDNVDVSLITRSATQVERLVSSQQYDVGYADVSYEGFSDSPLVHHEMRNLRCLCALSKHNPLARKAEITALDLDGRPMGVLYPEHPTAIQTREAFEKVNSQLNIRFTTQFFFPLLNFVSKQQCIALVDPITAHCYEQEWRQKTEIIFRPFTPIVNLTTTIMTPVHSTHSQIVEALIETLRNELNLVEKRYS